MTRLIFFCAAWVLLTSCIPKEQLELRGIRDILVETGVDGNALLKANAIFYNPNNTRMKIKEINVEIFVNGKKSAHADQKLRAIIPAKDQFTVPLVVKLSLKDFGLFDTVLSLLGGKKYEILYTGYVRVGVHGITVKVPINFKDQVKLKI